MSQLIKLNWFTPLTYKVIHGVFQKITGESPIILFAAETGIINYNGMMYFWDGIISDVNIFRHYKFNLEKGSSIGASKGGLGSAATLLPDNKIICMGGAGDKSTLMNLVTSGTVPLIKPGFNAVIGTRWPKRVMFWSGTCIPNAPKIPFMN
ncbi:unnamed protein product [Rhizophagus irregularis]|nr:unnamed protein product [Rhizophagus irregularis]